MNQASHSSHRSSYAPTMSLAMAQQRAQFMSNIRQFFLKQQVLEVQTPLLSQAGNTDTFLQSVAAQVTYQDKPSTYYLHTSPEFAMKRLLASWQVPIYQICPVFRDNEIGTRHNIEFTMLEWYQPNYSLADMAAEVGELLEMLYGYPVVMNHYRYVDAFMDFVGIHPLTASLAALQAVAEDKGLMGFDFNSEHSSDSEADRRQSWLDLLFSHAVEPHLGHDLPTLIIEYPPATAALAKTALDKEGNEVAKRFELYINGIEIANAYDELADGQALRARFEKDNQLRERHDLPVMPIDEHLIAASDNLIPCSGIAVGIDRLFMVIVGASSLEEVIPFPSRLA
ncbi:MULTISPECIES: EF-P lysine aminoacylase EpmA [Psychrobacter]|uniref:Elongation factor P--(R)-beta-lysine ligase n=1 Tax=Psychrobacter alimentarius TaxID=261164 RepID=A0ABM5ZVB3_9GAMM|nr:MULTISPECIES: EF-P lysine aminoacylase EpmA [Psychrobacter]AMT95976.1 elongation factor P--(R)-beta-lysine ligase [Psychrobacter alimentarius]QCB31605.1 EF-P lysine aminoacylase GenX [Psychrobacter sp. PAMC27889]